MMQVVDVLHWVNLVILVLALLLVLSIRSSNHQPKKYLNTSEFLTLSGLLWSEVVLLFFGVLSFRIPGALRLQIIIGLLVLMVFWAIGIGIF